MSTSTVGSPANALSTSYMADILATPAIGPLRIDDLLRAHGVTPTATPGNVGVCLSGGGTRAMCAGMGQLRGLKALQINGASLLSQVKAISTVSGGSWVGQTYSYLANSTISDNAYLGTYADPAALTLESIGTLVPGNLGNVCSDFSFSLPGVLLEAILLMEFHDTPPSMVWQVALGNELLSKYGLYQRNGASALPTSFFSYDNNSKNSIFSHNSSLRGACYLLADSSDAGREHRPFPICNMSMMVKINGKEYAAPVQSTPFFTGIVGTPDALDRNGNLVGGGGVTSFAFNSRLTGLDGNTATIAQSRPWSVTDMVGTSSAAIAAAIWTVAEKFQDNPTPLRDALNHLSQHHPAKLASLIPQGPLRDAPSATTTGASSGFLGEIEAEAKKLANDVETIAQHGLVAVEQDFHLDAIWDIVKNWLKALPQRAEMVPRYQYWPVLNAHVPSATQQANEFADGGYLENTGIGGMLAYGDIDALLVFVNSETPLTQSKCGIFAAEKDGDWLEGTNVLVDNVIPPLFGYCYDKAKSGYVLFDAANAGDNPMVKCQLFPSSDFAPLLRGLWQAANGQAGNARPATYAQSLVTLANPWFGVLAGKSVKVLWSYLNAVQSWYNKLPASVQPSVANKFPDWAKGIAWVDAPPPFPNFSTVFQTELSTSQVNLMTNLTAWCVADESNRAAYLGLFGAG